MWSLVVFRRNAEILLFLEYIFPPKPVYYLSYSKGFYGHVVTDVPHMENTDETFQTLFTSALKMLYEFVPGVNNLR